MKAQKEVCAYPDCEQEVPEYGALNSPSGRKVCYAHWELINFLENEIKP